MSAKRFEDLGSTGKVLVIAGGIVLLIMLPDILATAFVGLIIGIFTVALVVGGFLVFPLIRLENLRAEARQFASDRLVALRKQWSERQQKRNDLILAELEKASEILIDTELWLSPEYHEEIFAVVDAAGRENARVHLHEAQYDFIAKTSEQEWGSSDALLEDIRAWQKADRLKLNNHPLPVQSSQESRLTFEGRDTMTLSLVQILRAQLPPDSRALLLTANIAVKTKVEGLMKEHGGQLSVLEDIKALRLGPEPVELVEEDDCWKIVSTPPANWSGKREKCSVPVAEIVNAESGPELLKHEVSIPLEDPGDPTGRRFLRRKRRFR